MTNQGRVRLITRGDDLGSFRSANLAIMDAFRRGILRNTSVMVPAPYFEHAAALLREEPDICVGLHVTLNSEWDEPRWGPVSPPEEVPSLVDKDGYFYHDPIKLYERGINLAEAVREIQAQLDRARAHGLNIRYIDEHMGVGWIHNGDHQRRLHDEIRDLAAREGLIWFHDSCNSLPNVNEPDLSLIERVKKQIEAAQDGVYVLVTHPAYDADDMRNIVVNGQNSPELAISRYADYQLLCDASFAEFLQQRSVDVISYVGAAS